MKSFRAWPIVALCGLMGTLTACSSDSAFVKPGCDFRSVGKVAVLLAMNAGDAVQQQEVADMFAVHVLPKNYDVMDRANLTDLSNVAAFQYDLQGTSPADANGQAARREVSRDAWITYEGQRYDQSKGIRNDSLPKGIAQG